MTVAKDPIYEKIVGELKKDKSQYGRKIKLTIEMWYSFLTSLQFGGTIEQSAIASRMGIEAYKRYLGQSKTFRQEVERTRQNISLTSRLNIGQAILGKPAETKEVYNKKGEKIKVTVPAVAPDLRLSTWWQEQVDKIGIQPKEDAPLQLETPKTEQEADLWARMLNKHHDYVSSKSKPTEETTTKPTTRHKNKRRKA